MKTITIKFDNDAIMSYFQSKNFHADNVRVVVWNFKGVDTTVALEYEEENSYYEEDLKQARFLYDDCEVNESRDEE